MTNPSSKIFAQQRAVVSCAINYATFRIFRDSDITIKKAEKVEAVLLEFFFHYSFKTTSVLKVHKKLVHHLDLSKVRTEFPYIEGSGQNIKGFGINLKQFG